MPNITGHTELVGLMAYPIRHTQSPTTHNLAYDKNVKNAEKKRTK